MIDRANTREQIDASIEEATAKKIKSSAH